MAESDRRKAQAKDCRREALKEALHQVACNDGHDTARDAILEWQEGYTYESYALLIRDLAKDMARLEYHFTKQ